jgi:hypothetical protein
LELVPAVGVDVLDAEWELPNHVVQKVDRASLGMFSIDFQSPDTCCIIDRRVLVALDPSVRFVSEKQKLDIKLNLMTRDRFFVALEGAGRSFGRASR